MDEFTQDILEPTEQDLKVAEDAVPVCPNCFEPCDPSYHYCPKCGSNEAINPLASYLPFESIRFKVGMFGKLWRKIWDSDVALALRALYFCVFIVFMPLMFALLFVCAGHQYYFRNKRFSD